MMKKQIVIFIILILLFAVHSYATETKDTELVEKFGVGFNEVVIADS